MPFYVYILRCNDGTYYTGQTDDLDRRLHDHEVGFVAYTAKRRPFECVWAEDFQTRDVALGLEKQLKGWSRAKKEAFMLGDWDALQMLARCRGTA